MTTIDLNHETICINPTDDLTLYDKNHTMSRIEKFLFAICSLDSSDLPIPLSRIEELYNCLVTGDTPPTFDPLSRAEKFLMACLGAYDINKLPEPLSRSEVLLKKIATGDSNLEDVDNLQSKYEFLLAYIIQNGGIGGIDGDISYMKYTLTEKETTLYNTKKHLVRSAILIGDTKLIDELGNECDEPNTPKIHMGAYVNETTGELVESAVSFYTDFLKSPNVNFMIKGNSRYKRVAYYDKDKKYITGANSADQYNGVFRPHDIVIRPENAVYYRISASLSLEADATYTPDTKLSIVDQYGETLYPTELVSVKMPVLTITNRINVFIENKEFSRGYYNGGTAVKASHNYMDGYICDVEPNTIYSLYFKDGEPDTNKIQHVSFWNENTYISGWTTNPITFTTPANCNKLRFAYDRRATNINPLFIPSNIVLSIGTGVVYDESFKSNILTCNEEVTLRGIGNVKDELNLLTGELTQSLVERVFDGTENWIIGGMGGNYKLFRCESYTDMIKSSNIIVSDKYAYSTVNNASSNLNITFSTTTGKPCIVTSQVDLSLDDFKSKLSVDKPRVQYQLAEKVVKTVDLSIVDQDGNNTKLSTFDDITYVTLSSEGLIPEAELEVATKNEEVLNTLSLEMDDISTAQDILEESSNIQSENVDATMIATTEIYEGLL